MRGGMSMAGEIVADSAKAAARLSGRLAWVPWAVAGVALAAGGGGTLWYRNEWKDCQASVALDAAPAEEKLNAQKSLDAAFTRQLEEKLAPVINDLRKQADDTQVALAKVPSNPSCARTPAANAFDSSVRPNSQQTGAGAPRPTEP